MGMLLFAFFSLCRVDSQATKPIDAKAVMAKLHEARFRHTDYHLVCDVTLTETKANEPATVKTFRIETIRSSKKILSRVYTADDVAMNFASRMGCEGC
jgi:hypothetical protein